MVSVIRWSSWPSSTGTCKRCCAWTTRPIRSESQAAEAMGIGKGRSTYPAKKALAVGPCAGGRPASAEAMGLVADAELDLKGASGCPPEAVLEVLVARLCRLARAAAGGSPTRPARR